MRINQFVARSTGLSRRAADQAITAGRVTLSGHTAVLGEDVPDQAIVSLDGNPLAPIARFTSVMLNKPTGYVSSRARQGNDPTLYELLPAAYAALRIAGRLDRDSSGLVILSDDGDFIQRLTHPSYEKRKIYELELSRKLTGSDVRQLSLGVPLEDGPSVVSVVRHVDHSVTVSLGEGRNRQLRRTFGALGITVNRLHRTQIGPYRLGTLAVGRWRPVTGDND